MCSSHPGTGRGSVMWKPVLVWICCMAMFTLVFSPAVSPQTTFTIETEKGYVMDIGVFHTVDESQLNGIILSVKITNVSGPYILTCRISVDESMENQVIQPIDASRISTQMEGGMQVLTGTLALSFPEGTPIPDIPLFVSGLFSGCEGGCESFFIGPLEYRISGESSSPISIIQVIALLIPGCGLICILLHHKKRK